MYRDMIIFNNFVPDYKGLKTSPVGVNYILTGCGKAILFLVKSDRIADVFRSERVKFNYFGSGPV